MKILILLAALAPLSCLAGDKGGIHPCDAPPIHVPLPIPHG